MGSSRDFLLSRALLLYGESDYNGYPYRQPFVTVHDVFHEPNGEILLSPAQLATPAMLATLMAGVGQSIPVEILPECVLARTADMVVWWSPAKCRPLFFRGMNDDKALADRLNGKQYPQPPLLFKASGKSLWVRALRENQRPEATTKLCMAPYWNCYDNAVVCTGSMEIPQQKSVTAIEKWEHSFFHSAFTHAAGVKKHTRFPGGVLALWRNLQGQKRFPSKYLVPLPETLQQFVASNDKSYGNQRLNQE